MTNQADYRTECVTATPKCDVCGCHHAGTCAMTEKAGDGWVECAYEQATHFQYAYLNAVCDKCWSCVRLIAGYAGDPDVEYRFYRRRVSGDAKEGETVCEKEPDMPHRWTIEGHPYQPNDFDAYVTDSDDAAREAIMYNAEMHLWDQHEGGERKMVVTLNTDIPDNTPAKSGGERYTAEGRGLRSRVREDGELYALTFTTEAANKIASALNAANEQVEARL